MNAAFAVYMDMYTFFAVNMPVDKDAVCTAYYSVHCHVYTKHGVHGMYTQNTAYMGMYTANAADMGMYTANAVYITCTMYSVKFTEQKTLL